MKIYWIIVAILMGCSSSEKLDHRPYEIFLAPSYSYQKILKNSALTKPQKNQTFKDEIEAMEEMWEKQNLEKRKKFEKFFIARNVGSLSCSTGSGSKRFLQKKHCRQRFL